MEINVANSKAQDMVFLLQRRVPWLAQ
jgi:hypothetical protein